MFECMEDCIHLKACRRVQAIGKKHRLLVPRYCTEDCTAYQSRDTEVGYVSAEQAAQYARDGASYIRGGYDSYDIYCACDLPKVTIGEILADAFDEEEAEDAG